jgi:hypothetical protein
MRLVVKVVFVLAAVVLMAESGLGVVYLNRVLIECDPLTYKVEPLHLYGEALSLNRGYQNEYGDCVGDPPGPPFIIEYGVTIENVYNSDGTVLHWGSLNIDNSWGGGDPFVIKIGYGGLAVNGDLIATGRPGDPVIFSGDYKVYGPYGGGPGSVDLQDYTFQFTHCRFVNSQVVGSGHALDVRGGHLHLDNCMLLGGTRAIRFLAERFGVWDVTMSNCSFSGFDCGPGGGPVALNDIGSIEIHGVHFANCLYDVANSTGLGLIEINSAAAIGDITGLSGSGNSRNWIRLSSSNVYVRDSARWQSNNDFTIHVPNYLLVDTNAFLFVDKGSVLQMGPAATMHVKGSMIVDSAVITSVLDNTYGVLTPGVSTDVPSDVYKWYGIQVYPGAALELRNDARLRWTQYPVSGEGRVTLDHSTIEQCWGGINMLATSPSRLEVRGSTIDQLYSTAPGIRFNLSISTFDSASGRILIDSSWITQSGGDGIHIGGGNGRPLEDSLNITISNSVISGNSGSGIYGNFGPPADSVVIVNNRIVGNGSNGLYLADNGCDSMDVRLENNVAIGNGGSGLSVRTGFVDAIGNTSVFNGQMGLSYPYKPQKPGTVANNILACNDRYGLYCYAKYGGTVPAIAYNVFWQNNDGSNDLDIQADGFTISTVVELQALGGVGLTNEAFAPGLKSEYRDVIRFNQYNQTLRQSAIYVDGDSLQAGQLDGLAILPSHRDTTAWFYVLRNTSDTIYVAGDISSVVNIHDTLTVFEYHLAAVSPAIDFGRNDYVTTEYDVDGDARMIDGNEDGTATVDAGADEFNPDSTNIHLWVLRPETDSILTPGAEVWVVWATQGVDSVAIDFALDIAAGQAPQWQVLATSVPIAPNLFSWVVPDTLSYRTKVRIRDASGSGYQVESGYFHIKPSCLTRVTADSTYERFVPSVHAWQLPNEAGTLWPASWHSQFDYTTGTDPYTSRPYPGADTAYHFGSVSGDIFPDWPLFVRTFGADACYHNTPSGLMYVMRAIYFWEQIRTIWNGSCVGLSSSALLAFGNRDPLQVQWPDCALPDTLHSQAIDDSTRILVNYYQTRQFAKTEREAFADNFTKTPVGTLSEIKAMLLESAGDVAMVGIGNQPGDGWHAMAAYEVAPHADANCKSVRVYDPNRPGVDTSTIKVDTVANTWYYSGFAGWGGSKHFLVLYPVRHALGDPEFKGAQFEAVFAQDGDREGHALQLLFSRGADFVATDVAGDSVVSGGSGMINTIDGATPLIVFEGESAPPYGFAVPESEYAVTLNMTEDGMASVGAFFDSLYIGYARDDAVSGQTDELVIGDGLTLVNPDKAPRIAQLRMVRTMAPGERAIVVDDIQIGTGGSLELEPIDISGWYLSNPGEARTYTLWLRQVDADEERMFLAHEVPLDAGVGHIITPVWEEFEGDICIVYVDTDGDHVPDDSLTVISDIGTAVEGGHGGALPYRFELSQNYPNPFNPSTTIEYSLSRRHKVSIDVFNIMGQKVRTLIDREQSAGAYTITWDGTTDTGNRAATGIYLYRFQAGDYVETKKMLLLK